ncbi:MAG: hypothetical protein HY363_04475 [Candidatus Aenigmarchaeota archaeon]|nr:hypothetical protein [Candidatus Aenigmarchaeota archaeon]
MKKAPMYFVIGMIILAVLVIGALKFQLEFHQSLAGKKTKEDCKLSVLAASKLRIKDFELVRNIDCCQNNLVVKDKKEVVPAIAKSLYDCYFQFLKGEANLFTGTGSFCFICSTIHFEGSAAQGDIEEVYNYLFTKKPPASFNTYAKEFFGAELEQKREFTRQNIRLPNKDYMVIFLHDRQPEPAVPHLPPEEGIVVNKRADDIRSSFMLMPTDDEYLRNIQCKPVRTCDSV